jgi:predicted acyl esterase
MRVPVAALAASLIAAFIPFTTVQASPVPRATDGAPTDYSEIKGLSQAKYKTVRESYEVEMADGIMMYVEVERPKAPGRFGTILELSPYHGTIADRIGSRILPGPKGKDGKPIGMSGYFAPRGYAVVFADLRGTGKSEGCLDHMGPNDQSDAKTIVEWAAKQKWSNGRVGMTGHSYVGSTPQMAASQNPKGLVTIVPSAGLAAMYHHEFQLGVPYNLQWAGPLAAYEGLAIARHLPPGTPPIPVVGGPPGDNFGNDMQYFGCGATQSAAVTGEAYFSGAEVAWHKERDFRKGATKADIPSFLVHGINDNAARVAASDWFIDREGRAGDKAWIGQWDHGSGVYPNSRTCPQAEAVQCKDDEWTTALHAWFDKHLLQKKIDTGPAAEVFLNTGQVFTASEWPPRTSELKLFPSADGKLLDGAADEGTSTYVSDAQGFGNEFNTDNVSFTSAAVKRDTLIAGVPKMHLSISVTSPRVHIIPSLYDVSGAGQDRIGQSFCSVNPELRDGIDKPAVVVPTEVMEFDIECQPQAHLLEKGHKLMLMIASSHPDKVPTFASGTQVTVYSGGDEGTSVTLPVIYDPVVYDDVRSLPAQ